MKFRLIKVQEFDAYTNMALDEVLCDKLSKGETDPVIRLYRWKPSAVSIGYFQGIGNEVDLKKCQKEGIDVVRRRTGGGAVFHSNEGEITYSIMAPENLFSKNIIESYREVCEIVINGLRKLGIESNFAPINDIISNERKISGNAQTRKNGVFLQHGTILYSVDVEKMFSYLTVDKTKISDKLIKSVKKRVTSISNENSKLTLDDLENALIKAFSDKFEVYESNYSKEELKLAKELANKKYSSKEWNHMR